MFEDQNITQEKAIQKQKQKFAIAKDLFDRVNQTVDIVNYVNRLKAEESKQQKESQQYKQKLISENKDRTDLSAGIQSIEQKVANETMPSTGNFGIDLVMKARNTIASPETKEYLYNNLSKPVASFVQNAAESFFMVPTDNRETRVAEQFGLGYDEKTKKYIVPDSKIETNTDIMFRSLQQKAVDDLNREPSLFEKTMGITGGIVGILPSFAVGAGPASAIMKGMTTKLGTTGIGKLLQYGMNKTPWLQWLSTGAEHALGTSVLFGISGIPANTVKAIDDIGRKPFIESFIERELGDMKTGALLGSLGYLSNFGSNAVSSYIMDRGITNPVLKVNIAQTVGLTGKVLGSAGTGAVLNLGGTTDEILSNAMAFSVLHVPDVVKQTKTNVKSGQLRRDISTYQRLDAALEKPMSELDKQFTEIIRRGGEQTLKTLPSDVLTGYKKSLQRELVKNPDKKTELTKEIENIDNHLNDRMLGLNRPLTEEESGIIADKMIQRDITENELRKNIVKQEPKDVSFFGQFVGENATTLGSVITPLGDIGKDVVNKETKVLESLNNLIEPSKERGVDILNDPYQKVTLKSGKEGVLFDVLKDLISDRTGINPKTVSLSLDRGIRSLQQMEKQKKTIQNITDEINNRVKNNTTDNNELNLTKTGEDIKVHDIETDRRHDELSEMIWKNNDERKLFEGMSYRATKAVVLSPDYNTETPIEFIDMLQSKKAIDPDKAYTDFVQNNMESIRAKYGTFIDPKEMELRLRNVYNTWSNKVPTPLVKISVFKDGKTPYPNISTTVIGAGQNGKAFSQAGPYQEIAKVNNWQHVNIDNMDLTYMDRKEEGYPFKPGLYEYDEINKEFVPANEQTTGRLYEKKKQLANINDIITSGASVPSFFIDLLKNDIIATGANNTKQLLSFKGDFSNYYQDGAFGKKIFYNTNVIDGTMVGGRSGMESISRQLNIFKEYSDIFGKGELELEQIHLNSKAEELLSSIGITTYKDFFDNFVINDNKTAAKFQQQLTKAMETWNTTYKPEESLSLKDTENQVRSAGEEILGSMVWTIQNAKIFASAFGYTGKDLPKYIQSMYKTDFSKTFKRGSLFNKTEYAAPDNNLAMSIFAAEKPSSFIERDGKLYVKTIIGKTTNLSERLSKKIEDTDEKWKDDYKDLATELNWDKDKTAYDGGSHFTDGNLEIFNRMLGMEGFGGSNKNQIALPGFAIKHAIFEFDSNDIINKKLKEKNIGLFIDKENAKILNFDIDILKGKKIWLPGEQITSDHVIDIPIDAFRIILNKNDAHRTTAGLNSVYGSIDNTNQKVRDLINNGKYDIHKTVLDIIREDSNERLKDYNALIDKLNNSPSGAIDLLLKSIDKNNLDDLELVRMFEKYPDAITAAPELMVRVNSLLSKGIDNIVSGQAVGSSPILMPYSYEKTITGIYRMVVRDYLRVHEMKLDKENTMILWDDIERQVQEYRNGTRKNPEIESKVKKIIAESFDGRVLKEGYGVVGREIADIHKITNKNNKMLSTVIPTETFANMGVTKIIGVDKGNNTFMVTPKMKMGIEGKDFDGDTNYLVAVNTENKNKLWDILWESKDKVNNYYKDYRRYDIDRIGVQEFQKNMEIIGLKPDPSLAKFRDKISSPFSVFNTIQRFIANKVGEVTNASKIINTIVHSGIEKQYDLMIGDKKVGTVTYGRNDEALEQINEYLGSLKTALVDPKNGHIGVKFSQNDLIIKALEGKIDIQDGNIVTPEQLQKALGSTRKQFTDFYKSITSPVTTLTYGKEDSKTIDLEMQSVLISQAKKNLAEYPQLANSSLYQTIRDIDVANVHASFSPYRADKIRTQTYNGLESKYGKLNSKVRQFMEAGLSGKVSEVETPEFYNYLVEQYPMRDFKSDYLQYASTLTPQKIGDTNKYNLLETKPTLQFAAIQLNNKILGDYRTYIPNSKEIKTKLKGRDNKEHTYDLVVVPSDPRLLLRLGVDRNKIKRLANNNIVGVITDETGKVYTKADSELYKINETGKSTYITFFGDATKLQYNKHDITKGRRRLQLLENIMFSSVTPETKMKDIELLTKEGINGKTLSEDGKKRAIATALDPRIFVGQYRLDEMERDIQNINKYGTNIDLGPKMVNKLMPGMLDEFYTDMGKIAKSPDKVTDMVEEQPKPEPEQTNTSISDVGNIVKNEITQGIKESGKEIRKINENLAAYDPSFFAAATLFIGVGLPLLRGVYRGTILGLTAIDNARELKKEFHKTKADRSELVEMFNSDWTKNRDNILGKIDLLEKERGQEIYGLSWLKDMVQSPSFIKTMEDMSPENKYNRMAQWMGIVDFMQSYRKAMKPMRLKDDFMTKMVMNHTEPIFISQYFSKKTQINSSDDKFIDITDFLTGKKTVWTFGHLAKWNTMRPSGSIVTTGIADQAMVHFNLALEAVKGMGNLGESMLNMIHRESGKDVNYDIVTDIIASRELKNVKFDEETGNMIVVGKDGKETEFFTTPWAKGSGLTRMVNDTKIPNKDAREELDKVVEKFTADYGETFAKRYSSLNKNTVKRKEEELIGINEIYNTTDLSKIGTADQYTEYLNTIFPNSKLKNIAFHFGNVGKEGRFSKDFFGKGEGTNSSGNGFYFADSFDTIMNYSGLGINYSYENSTMRNMISSAISDNKLVLAILDIKNPGHSQKINSKKNDAILNIEPKSKMGEYVVFEPDQIHVMGSNKDIREFSDYVKQNSSVDNRNDISIEQVKSAMRTTLMLQQYNRWYMPKYLNGFKNMLIDIDSNLRDRYGEGIGVLEAGKDINNQIRQIKNYLVDLENNNTYTPFVPIIFKTEKHREKFNSKMKEKMTEEYINVSKLDPNKPQDMELIDKKLGELTFHNYLWLEKDKDGNLWQDNPVQIGDEVGSQKSKVVLNGFQKRGILKGVIKGKYGIDVENIVTAKKDMGLLLSKDEQEIMDRVISETNLELKNDKTIKENNKFNVWGAHTHGYSYEMSNNYLLPLKLRGEGLDEFYKGDYGIYKGTDAYDKWHTSFTESLRLRTANLLFKFYDNKMKQLDEHPIARKAVLDAFRRETGAGYGFYDKTNGTKLNIGDIVQIDAKDVEMPFSDKKDVVIPDGDSFVHGIVKEPNTVDWISGVVVSKENSMLKIRDYLNENEVYNVPADRAAYIVNSASNLTGFADTLAKFITMDKTDINKRTNRSEAILKLPEMAIDLLTRLGVASAIGGPNMPRFAANNLATLDIVRTGGMKSMLKYIYNTPFFVKSLFNDNALPIGGRVKQNAYIGLGNMSNITYFQSVADVGKPKNNLLQDYKKIVMSKEERERSGEVTRIKAFGEVGNDFLKQIESLWHGAGLQLKQEGAVRKYNGADGIERSYIIKSGEIAENSKKTNKIDEGLDFIAAMTAINSTQGLYDSFGRPQASNTKFGKLYNMFLTYRSSKIASIGRELQESHRLSLYKMIDKEFFNGNSVTMPDINGNLRNYTNWNKTLKRHAKEYIGLATANTIKSYIKQGLAFGIGNAILGLTGLKKDQQNSLWEDLTYYFGWTYSIMDSYGRLMGENGGEIAQAAMDLTDNTYIQDHSNKYQFAKQLDKDGKMVSNIKIDADIDLIRKTSLGLFNGFLTEKAFLLGIALNHTDESEYARDILKDPNNNIFLKAPKVIYDMVSGKPAKSLPDPVSLINPFRINKSDKDYLNILMEDRNRHTQIDIDKKKFKKEYPDETDNIEQVPSYFWNSLKRSK